jgi:hypothetical protein
MSMNMDMQAKMVQGKMVQAKSMSSVSARSRKWIRPFHGNEDEDEDENRKRPKSAYRHVILRPLFDPRR